MNLRLFTLLALASFLLLTAGCGREPEETPASTEPRQPAAEPETGNVDETGTVETAETEDDDRPAIRFDPRLGEEERTEALDSEEILEAVREEELEASPDVPAEAEDALEETVPEDFDEEEMVEFTHAAFLEYYPPFYPLHLRLDGYEGQVIVRVTIDEEGNPADLQVARSTARELNSYALDAAQDWRFLPALVDGEPMEITIEIPMTFLSEFGSLMPEPGSPLEGLVFLDGVFYRVDERNRFSRANTEVTPIDQHPPAYPRELAGERQGGEVVLSFTVTEEGRVSEPSVVSSTYPEFEEPALKAIRYWSFLPRIRNGEAVSSRVEIPIVFSPEAAEEEHERELPIQ